MKAPLTERVAGKRNLRIYSLRFEEKAINNDFTKRYSWISIAIDKLIDRAIEYDRLCPALRRGVQ